MTFTRQPHVISLFTDHRPQARAGVRTAPSPRPSPVQRERESPRRRSPSRALMFQTTPACSPSPIRPACRPVRRISKSADGRLRPLDTFAGPVSAGTWERAGLGQPASASQAGLRGLTRTLIGIAHRPRFASPRQKEASETVPCALAPAPARPLFSRWSMSIANSKNRPFTCQLSYVWIRLNCLAKNVSLRPP